MNPRTILLILQGLGALTLLAYPGVFLASIMSLAAGDEPFGVLVIAAWVFFVATLAYPVIWGILWWRSWRALRNGRPRRALLLSSPPAALAVAALMFGTAVDLLLGDDDQFQEGIIKHATAHNPLGGALLSFQADKISWEELRGAIDRADSLQLSTPLDPPPDASFLPSRSPLGIALEATGLGMEVPLRPVNERFVEAARLLMARGATLSSREIAEEPRVVWLAEIISTGTSLPDERAKHENPVAWIVLASYDPKLIGTAGADGIARRNLLSTPTRTYGTPLRIALTQPDSSSAHALIQEGATLSPAESKIPSLMHHLEELFREKPHLRQYYDESERAAGKGR